MMALIGIKAKSTRWWVRLQYLSRQQEPALGLVLHSLRYVLLSKKMPPQQTPEGSPV